ncbi:CDP-glycerol glycerophosphotransferase family protein [Secundilactobacillus oryzae]|uniref:CDP-glycerol glycerophosphotransferase family protein n=1 Tax=Secundilactobacillus oryzae TaxID=1202668 RepID=UPI002093A7CF|nr:CDP-glycerol glycerophosphotransferase family protein [Secundilactobacillus oryzae]
MGLDIENVSMPGTTTAKYHVNFVKEANRWDALVSPNDYSTRIFRSAFGYNNKILKVGYPRNDKLINSSADDITALKAELGIPADKKKWLCTRQPTGIINLPQRESIPLSYHLVWLILRSNLVKILF